MSVKVLLFAAAREAAGGTREQSLEAATIAEALKVLIERHGAGFERIAAISTVLRNDEVVGREDATLLTDRDVIAILPPVSGGQPDVKMVDVGDKDETVREATAVCTLHGDPGVLARLLAGELKKGDAVAAAKVAGTLAAKRTPELIPLCHPVRTTFAGVEIAGDGQTIEIRATVRGRDRTGFEIEALVAASTAALTLYDMAKSEDPQMRIDGLRIVAKSGGKSGSVTYP